MFRAYAACASCAYFYPHRRGIIDSEAVNLDGGNTVPVPEKVLASTRGKRDLFVSNRADGELQARLDALLEFGALEWAEASPRRNASAVEAIAAGSYDLVLGATGFLGHKDDGQLARACRCAGVPFIRADKGRPGAVIRALSRDRSHLSEPQHAESSVPPQSASLPSPRKAAHAIM